MVSKKPKREVYKKLNIPFTKELYEKLERRAEKDLRSLTQEIIFLLEEGLKEK